MNAAEAVSRLHVEELVVHLLAQLAVILPLARLFAVVGRRLGQPYAVGEIIAGLVLGPSFFKWVAPAAWSWLFQPELGGLGPELSAALMGKVFAVLSQLGLILLLFIVGLEFDFSHLKWNGPAALAISLAGIILPMGFGAVLAPLMHPALEVHPATGQPVPLLGFALFLGVALSITAIPILGRMMIELNITRTRLGVITIAAAAVDDAAGWILLATVAGIVRSSFEPGGLVRMVAETVGFTVFMIVVARPLLTPWLVKVLKQNEGELGLNALAVVLALLFGCAIVTGSIGIFAIFGAFLFGAVLSGVPGFRDAASGKLRDFVTGFFLPIFFTSTGLRTNIGSLGSIEMWLWAAAVFAAALLGKFGGCGIAARLSGFPAREAACIGVMMNTRALMELIVINAGFELGVIPPSVYCMLVFMALGTTVMTTPILLWLMTGTELEPCIRASGFLPGSRPAPLPAAVTPD